MSHTKFTRIISWLILIAFLLTSCGSDHPPAPPQDEQPSTTIPESEQATPIEQDTSLEEAESNTDQETFPASYIGKTVGDVVRDFGGEYAVDYYEGSTMIGYPDNFWFLFGIAVDTITDDLIIRQVMAGGQYPVVYDLKGSMTYPEIVEAVKGEADVPPPESFFHEIHEEWETTTGFSYRGYELIYWWDDDPENTPSAYVHIFKLGVESVSSDPAPDFVPAEDQPDDGYPLEDPVDGSDSWESQNPFSGPGWFEGVLGCKFNVPAGFVEYVEKGLVRGPGMHRYSFRSDELDMRITVFECLFDALPITAADMPVEYQSASTSENVTYSASGNEYYVVSGYLDDDMIYYTRVDYNDVIYTSLDFEYPSDNADACEKVLLKFLEDYSVG